MCEKQHLDLVWSNLSEDEKWRCLGGKLWNNRLPCEIMMNIGTYLDAFSIDNMRLVCKTFSQIFSPVDLISFVQNLYDAVYLFVNELAIFATNSGNDTIYFQSQRKFNRIVVGFGDPKHKKHNLNKFIKIDCLSGFVYQDDEIICHVKQKNSHMILQSNEKYKFQKIIDQSEIIFWQRSHAKLPKIWNEMKKEQREKLKQQVPLAAPFKKRELFIKYNIKQHIPFPHMYFLKQKQK